MLIGLSNCSKDEAQCGSDIGDRAIQTLPNIEFFEILAIDTVENWVKVRYTSDIFPNLCTKDKVSLSINVLGDYTLVSGALYWSNQQKTNISMTPPTEYTPWTGTSIDVDISNVYGDNAGKIWGVIDLTFEYTSNNTSIDDVYSILNSKFEGFYLNPHANEFKP